jgi:hypothetical protein
VTRISALQHMTFNSFDGIVITAPNQKLSPTLYAASGTRADQNLARALECKILSSEWRKNPRNRPNNVYASADAESRLAFIGSLFSHAPGPSCAHNLLLCAQVNGERTQHTQFIPLYECEVCVEHPNSHGTVSLQHKILTFTSKTSTGFPSLTSQSRRGSV